ncbi:hypothetical protein BRADI_1g51633v3 [Brachypodium distachyon]|uniref:Uncharacterized protein n=1 Tax=Brachypodium distachyon TaxID=15368 RepID=A0A0Q3S438_BRADI|nr:hypothetical protein BRADI_1g51633v3 [Brachypodium distachyon]
MHAHCLGPSPQTLKGVGTAGGQQQDKDELEHQHVRCCHLPSPFALLHILRQLIEHLIWMSKSYCLALVLQLVTPHSDRAVEVFFHCSMLFLQCSYETCLR